MALRILWNHERSPRNAWMMQPERDQRNSEVPDKKIIICTSPRTGSNSLCHLLLSAGLGIPWEYLGEGRADTLATRWGLPLAEPQSVEFFDTLMRQRGVNDVFGLKVQWRSARRYLSDAIWRQQFGDALVIYLDREDRAAQEISLAVALATGRWFQNADAAELDLTSKKLAEYLPAARSQISDELSGWAEFFPRFGLSPMHLCMEDFVSDPVRAVEEIARRLGAEIDHENLRKHAGFVGKYVTDANLKLRLSHLVK